MSKQQQQLSFFKKDKNQKKLNELFASNEQFVNHMKNKFLKYSSKTCDNVQYA